MSSVRAAVAAGSLPASSHGFSDAAGEPKLSENVAERAKICGKENASAGRRNEKNLAAEGTAQGPLNDIMEHADFGITILLA